MEKYIPFSLILGGIAAMVTKEGEVRVHKYSASGNLACLPASRT